VTTQRMRIFNQLSRVSINENIVFLTLYYIIDDTSDFNDKVIDVFICVDDGHVILNVVFSQRKFIIL